MTTLMMDQTAEDAALLAEMSTPFSAKAGRLKARLTHQLEASVRRSLDPSQTKVLRRFSLREAAMFLDLGEGALKAALSDPEAPRVQRENGRPTFGAGDIHAVRAWLSAADPGKRVGKGAGDATQILAVANFKGGSAKTTTTVHLAQYLALRGYRVLAVDMDPQGSLTSSFGVQPLVDVADDHTALAIMDYDDRRRRSVIDVVRRTYIPGLDLIPANSTLSDFGMQCCMAFANKAKNGEAVMFHLRLKQALSPVTGAGEPGDAYDVVLIDCPPQIDYLTTCALGAATGLLIPVHPQMIDLHSFEQFISRAHELRQLPGFDDHVGILWHRIVFTRYDTQETGQRTIHDWMVAKYREEVLPASMIKTATIADAGRNHETLYEMTPPKDSRATYQRAMDTMDRVNGEVERLLKSTWRVSREAERPSRHTGLAA